MKQLVQLQQRADEFEAVNAEVIVVFREEQEGSAGLHKIRDRTDTDFTLTTDLDKQATAAYSPESGTFHNYVIDSQGILRADIDGSLQTRATGDELLEELNKLAR